MAMKFILRYLPVLFFLFFMTGFWGCADDINENPSFTPTGSAVFSLTWPDKYADQRSLQAQGPSSINCIDISDIQVDVYDEFNDIYLKGESFSCEAGEGIIYDIPSGSNRQFVVSALDADGNPLFRGKSSLVKIPSGRAINVGSVEMEEKLKYVSISNPRSGNTFNINQPVYLVSSWNGPEDEISLDARLLWSSNINKNFGRDWTCYISTLSEGTHTITFSIKDKYGVTWKDSIDIVVGAPTSYTNDLGMKFNLVPAGIFKMGSPEYEKGRYTDEKQHDVTLTKSFYIQTTEVNQGQWEDVMQINPSVFSECGPNCPVESVTWYDCVIFCNKLSQEEKLTPCYYSDSSYDTVFDGTPPVTSGTVHWKKDANGYRLPTAAEWGFAARAGSTTAFANGGITVTDCDLDPVLNDMGWYCGNSDEGTHRVKKKDANAWGLYDMHGNVWEWCHDWYDRDYYYNTNGPLLDPTGPDDGPARVLRGGSWINHAGSCRSAVHHGSMPGIRKSFYGFRLVCSQVSGKADG